MPSEAAFGIVLGVGALTYALMCSRIRGARLEAAIAAVAGAALLTAGIVRAVP